jgi:hypothetical protein
MKFTVTFKCPDAVSNVLDSFSGNENDIPEEFSDAEDMRAACEDVLDKFVLYGEMVTIQFDTDGQTATVVKA